VVKITGAREHAARLRRLSDPNIVREIGAALLTAGEMIEKDAEISITTGAVSGKNHVPSKPGDAPMSDTHVLDGNIEAVLTAPLQVEVTSNAPYAVALEFGTSRMLARPYMRPAVQRQRSAAAKLVREVVNKHIRGKR